MHARTLCYIGYRVFYRGYVGVNRSYIDPGEMGNRFRLHVML